MSDADHNPAPGLRGLELFRRLPEFRKDPLGLFLEMRRRFGDVVCFSGMRVMYLLAHPDHVMHVLQDQHRNYPKGGMYNELRSSLGDGLLVSEGEQWRRQRRLAQPAFHKQRIGTFAKIMTEATEQMLERWRPYAAREQPLDILPEVMRLTLQVVGHTLFSTDLSGSANALRRALAVGRDHALRRMRSFVKLPDSIPTPHNLRFRLALRTGDKMIADLIAARRSGEVKADDLLGLLMEARDEETGEAMNDRQLRDEAITIIVAGHETVSNALAWTWYLLSQHPAAETELRRELAAVLGGRTPTVEDLPRLQYTRRVLEESMRLFPPAWVILRKALADDEIGGYHIRANSTIFLCPFVTHRHPDFWERENEFDPERFSPEVSAARPRYAYFPFGGGPRQCIGNNFAMQEAQLILATVAQKYSLRLVAGHPVVPDPSITLRPRYGLKMTLHEV